MPRKTITLGEAIALDFDRLATLVRNLLVSNRNFATGHYFREYPQTQSFARHVLPEHAEVIVGRIEELKSVVAENLDAATVAIDNQEVLRITRAALQVSRRYVQSHGRPEELQLIDHALAALPEAPPEDAEFIAETIPPSITVFPQGGPQ